MSTRAMIKVLAILAAVGMLAVVLPSSSVEARTLTVVSDSGQRGIDDLRKCLATADTLQVYLLVDSSGSMAETDPGNKRSALIGNSLRQLAAIRDDVTVEYSLGFFSNRFEPMIGWTPLSGRVDAESERVRKAIVNQPASGGTNWPAAIAGAQAALRSKQAPGACQAMIWLTDGGISVGENSPAENASAINALCGAQAMPGGAAPPAGSRGLFGEFRQSGVVLFGVMLRDAGVVDEQAAYVPFMKPLVEGEGTVKGKSVTCGEYPVPERHSHGVYLEATSADDLGAVFLQLATLVDGGAQAGIDADGGFPVDPGIKRFALILSGSTWTLTTPSGGVVTAADATAAGYVLEQGGSSTRVSSPVLVDSDLGDWKLDGAPGASVYYFSDLRLEIDPPQAMLAGADNEVTGRVLGASGEPRSLDEFEFELELSTLVSGGAEPAPIERFEVNPQDGTFTLHYFAEDASGVVTLQAALTEIITRRSSLPVADVAAEITVTVTVPENYPTVTPSTVALSTLSGSDGRATGAFTVAAPADGTAGRVCFPEGSTAVIDSDAASRADTWEWSYSLDEPCVDLLPQETVDVTLTAENSVPANSTVAAHLSVEYASASGDLISGAIPLAFETERPVNLGAFTLLFLLLVLLGLALPVLALQLLNWWFTRINTGAHLSRLSQRVQIAPDGTITTPDGRPLADAEWGLDHWNFVTKSEPVRSMVDADLGTLRARVAVNPLSAPWYELVPRAGHRIFGSPGDLPRRLHPKQTAGELLGIRGDLGHLWAISVDAAAIGSAQPMTGTLVAYLRNSTGEESAFQRRVAAVAQEAARSSRVVSGWTPPAPEPRPEPPKPDPGGRTGTTTPPINDEPPRRRPGGGAAGDSEPPRRDPSRSTDRGSAPFDPPRRDQGGSGPSTPPPSRREPPPSSSEPPRRSR